MNVTFRRDNSLRFLSYNIRGLSDMTKLTKIKDRFLYPEKKSDTPDLYTFQEIHSSPELMKFWKLYLPGKITASYGSTKSGGVLLGVHPASSINLISSVEDIQGSYVIAECSQHGEFFTVVSVYFKPQTTKSELTQLLSEIADKVQAYGHNRVIWMGDFNIVLNPQQDSSTGSRAENKREILLPFLDSHELTDIWRSMHPFESRFTVRTHGRQFFMSRIDFMLVSPALLTGVVSTDIGSAYCSDHSPIWTDIIISKHSKGKGYWKFPDFLLTDSQFEKEMQASVTQLMADNAGTNPGLLWDTAKSGVRGFTREYLSRVKKDRQKKVVNLESDIERASKLRDSLSADPYRAAFYADRVKNLQARLDSVYHELNAEKLKWHKAQNYYESNRCTKYYFKQPGAKNDAIKCVYNSEGNLVHDSKQVLHECRKYYDNLYSQPPRAVNESLREKFLARIPRDALTQKGYDILAREISLDELYQALKQMKKGTVPGEDGLTVQFYIKYWDFFKQMIFDSYRHAFETGKLSISQRKGLIRLLPKRDKNPLFVSSWRPICLLDVDFKVLTKVFSLRLAASLPDLIHPDQKGFVPHRTIHENLMDLQSIIADVENNNSKGMLILLDIHKAFDTLSWSFLRKVLQQYNFPEYFVTWFDIFYNEKEFTCIQ